MYVCGVFAGETVRFWVLCPSDCGASSQEITGRHAILDGSRGHQEAELRHRGQLSRKLDYCHPGSYIIVVLEVTLLSHYCRSWKPDY